MVTELMQFNGDSIRVIEHEGKQLAYMPDVARSFGLRSNNVIPTLDTWDYVELAAEISAASLPGVKPQHVSPYWLTESGIWHLTYALSPELRQKVNEEMLPQIRRTGAFTPKLTNGQLARMVLEEEYAKEQALAQLAIASPKAAYYDSWFNTEGLVGKADLARLLKEHFGGKVTPWMKYLTVGGSAPLWGKGAGTREGSIILAHHVTAGRGGNKLVEDSHGGPRKWPQGFATKAGVEWVLDIVEKDFPGTGDNL